MSVISLVFFLYFLCIFFLRSSGIYLEIILLNDLKINIKPKISVINPGIKSKIPAIFLYIQFSGVSVISLIFYKIKSSEIKLPENHIKQH